MDGNLDMGHARALLAVDGATQVQLGHQIIVKGLSVREAELLVTRAQRGEGKPHKKSGAGNRDRDMERLEEELSDMLGAVVTLRTDGKGRGKVVVAFSSLDQLDGILTRLRR